jgi:hypothetical protein
MLNREKYGNEIIELAVNKGIFALKDGKPMLCRDINCKDCDFYVITACKGNTYYFREWLNSEYVEPPVDWSKVAVDTPILVRDHENCEWTRRHFAKIKNGTVFAWRGLSTSWSEDDEETIPWKYAKLAESEE